MDIQLNVTGMTCGHCKAAVENALKSVQGVSAVMVNLDAGKAEVHGERVNPDALVAAIAEEGYSASITTNA
jgi:copper chaperone